MRLARDLRRLVGIKGRLDPLRKRSISLGGVSTLLGVKELVVLRRYILSPVSVNLKLPFNPTLFNEVEVFPLRSAK